MTERRPAPRHDVDWKRRFTVWGGISVAVLVALLIGAAFIPRWWAHRVGDQANESFAGGIMLGLFYGFVFTVLPLLLMMWGIRRRRSGKAWLWILAGAALLALPNLLTLGVVLGPGGAAHAAERTFDVNAPGFRNATLAGAVLGFAAIAFVWYLLRSRHHAREAERRARAARPGP